MGKNDGKKKHYDFVLLSSSALYIFDEFCFVEFWTFMNEEKKTYRFFRLGKTFHILYGDKNDHLFITQTKTNTHFRLLNEYKSFERRNEETSIKLWFWILINFISFVISISFFLFLIHSSWIWRLHRILCSHSHMRPVKLDVLH